MIREKTKDEIQKEFIKHIKILINYWDEETTLTSKAKLNGLAFSILAMLDGTCDSICGFIVAPLTI